MRYIPYGQDLERVANIVVGAGGNDATALELSQRPGNTTPAELKSDTSLEIVLNYLRSPQRDAYTGAAEAVSSSRYDVDGLLSLWAMLNPEAALKRAELLAAVAACASFDRWCGEVAAKIACALRGLATLDSSPVKTRLDEAGSDLERTAHLYQETLPLLPQLLDNVSEFESYWRDEYLQVDAGRSLFAEGTATVKETPEVDLAAFTLPEEVHNIALYEQTNMSRVALLLPEQRYQARYRYETWVEMASQRPPPRIDLRPFADLLEAFEGRPGEWIADDVSSAIPQLQVRGGDGESSITPGLFVRLLAQHLRDNAANDALLWSPYAADEGGVEERPGD